MTYNICQNILFLAAIFKFKINGNDLFLNPIILKDNKKWHFQTQSFTFSFPKTMLIVVWGWGKVKHKMEEVTEGWKVYRVVS